MKTGFDTRSGLINKKALKCETTKQHEIALNLFRAISCEFVVHVFSIYEMRSTNFCLACLSGLKTYR